MPRRLKKTHYKKIVSKAVEDAERLRIYGVEPEPQDYRENQSALGTTFNWYWANHKALNPRQFLIDYFSKSDKLQPGFDRMIPYVPNEWINLTTAWMCRILSRGGRLSTKNYLFIYDKTQEMILHIDTTPKIVVSVRDHTKRKVSAEIATLEGMIDEGTIRPGWNFHQYCEKQNISPLVASHITDYFKPKFDEVMLALSGTDEILNEAYGKYTERELKVIAAKYMSFIKGVEKIKEKKEEEKQIKSAKPSTYEEIMEHFKWCRAWGEIKSISPRQVLLARELWTFDYSHKRITVFRSKGKGLGIHRMSITEFDPDTSYSFNTGKLTDAYLTAIRKANPQKLEQVMSKDKVNVVAFTARINEQTLLLRVF